MPQGVFTNVYAVSSEDPNYPATNLLKNESGKKWKIKTVGLKSAFVVLQFDKSQKITGIDIGNEHSAFIEVLVGRSSSRQDDYKEILITSSFMTPPESKNSTNVNRVRCFSKESLVQSTAEEKWDLVQFLCTQPFNRNVQYGIGFVKVHVAADDLTTNKEQKNLVTQQFLQNQDKDSLSVSSTNKTNTDGGDASEVKLKFFGSFKLREDDSPDSESENSAGLFRRWKQSKQNGNDHKLSTAASIREASNPSHLKKYHENLKPLSKIIQELENNQSKPSIKNDELNLDRNRNDLLFGKEDEITNEKLEREIASDQERIKNEKEKQLKNEKEKQLKDEKKKQLKDEKKKHKPETEKKKDNSFTKTKHTDNSRSEAEHKKADDKKPKIKDDTRKDRDDQKSRNDMPSTSISHKKRPSSPNPSIHQTKKPKNDKPQQYKPFDELLQGVTIVISGIQNPDRAEIRQKALEMGAKYKPDWDRTCTHLICAFMNTPKYNQVKGHGKIIKRDWIEKCYNMKKRIPWRRYAIDKKDKEQPESEDEIYDISLKLDIEEINKELKIDNNQLEIKKTTLNEDTKNKENHSKKTSPIKINSDTDDTDTEDELERIRNIHNTQKISPKQKLQETLEKHSLNNDNPNNEPISVYDISTEEEPETADIIKIIDQTTETADIIKIIDQTQTTETSDTLNSKKFFKNLKFFIGHVGAVDEIKLKQYITKYGGEIINSLFKSNYAITKIRMRNSKNFNGEMVYPTWVYECNEMECLIPTEKYRLKCNSGENHLLMHVHVS